MTTLKSTNELYNEFKHLIDSTIKRNYRLLAALRLERKDVAQDLAIAMMSAIDKFDPSRSESLAMHIACSLQYEIFNMKQRFKPHGMTGVPQDTCVDFIYINDDRSDYAYGLPSNDGKNMFESSELLSGLSENEDRVLKPKLKGNRISKNRQIAIPDGVWQKYSETYESERRIAA